MCFSNVSDLSDLLINRRKDASDTKINLPRKNIET